MITRKDFIKLSGTSLSALSLTSMTRIAASMPESIHAPLSEPEPNAFTQKPTGKRPNIVLILADDMGYGDIGALNFGASETPAIDRLMQEGTLLTQHYAGSAVCSPSRACLMTGRYPHRTGVIDTPGKKHDLALSEQTIANVLSNAGYATGMVGKWHLGSGPGYRAYERGFQECSLIYECNNHWNRPISRNGVLHNHDGEYLADVLTEESIQFIKRHQNEPFFLYLAHFAPHTPLQAPEEDIQPFRDKGISENVSTLYGMIRRMDRGIGRVLETLKQLGLEDDTLVVFTSDNGPQFATTWEDRTSLTRYNCGFNGHKDLIYEGGIRVPAIVRWPNGLPCTMMRHEMTHFSDWFPTLLDVAGVQRPKDLHLDGQTMLPLLRGEDYIVAPRRYWQFSRYFPTPLRNAAVRNGDWKLVRPCKDDVTGPILGLLPPKGIASPTHLVENGEDYIPKITQPLAPQLFNLREDPQERFDLSAQYPDKLNAMQNDLDQWYENVMTDYYSIKKT